VIAKFVMNNKVHAATKVLSFMTNYRRELGMKADIKRKKKVEKTTKFAKRMMKIQEKAEVALRKV